MPSGWLFPLRKHLEMLLMIGTFPLLRLSLQLSCTDLTPLPLRLQLWRKDFVEILFRCLTVFLLSNVGNGQMEIKEVGYIYDRVILNYSLKRKQYFVRYTVYLDSWYVF